MLRKLKEKYKISIKRTLALTLATLMLLSGMPFSLLQGEVFAATPEGVYIHTWSGGSYDPANPQAVP
ncbi:putative secreted protein [Peptoniphilus sp. ING2-D1G]|nr:putative secreted protein [Peptoniphilus sp. ING2-D1G]